MRRVVYSYIRFSSAEQAKGHSMDRQMDYAKKYAETNNMLLDESLTMKDEGLSAYHQTHIKRGAFGIFLSAVESGKVVRGSVLIVESLDRISRAEPIEAQYILSQIIMAGITVITASDGKVYERDTIKKNPTDLIHSLIIFVRANEESETKSKRVKASIVGQINKWIENGRGKIIRNGRDPYWCRSREDRTGFDLIPERVIVIKDIINRYRSGWGGRKIVVYLNENYEPFNGKQWNMQFISLFMKKRSLVGERSFNVDGNSYVIKNYYPALMTDEEFSDLQHVIKSRATTKAQSSLPNILTGMRITYCGYCSNVIGAQNYSNRATNGKLKDSLRRIYCHSWKLGTNCLNNKTISVAPVEKCILEYCLDYSDMKMILAGDDETVEHRSNLSRARIKLDEVSSSIKNAEDSILQLLSTGQTISSVINDLVKKLKYEKNTLEEEVLGIEEKISFLSRHKSDDIVSEWNEVKGKAYDLNEETRLLIRQLVKRTFKRIDIFMHGMHNSELTEHRILKKALGTGDDTIDLIVAFHNNKTRILSIDKKTGSWVKGGDIDQQLSVESALQGLAERQTSETVEPV